MAATPTRWPSRSWAALMLLVLVAPACGGGSPASPSASSPAPSPATTPSAVVVLTGANFSEVVLSGRNVCMVEFYSPTCTYCRAMEPIVERLAADFSGRAVVGKLNADTEPALVSLWGVPGWPTFVVVKGGRESSRYLGATTYDELARMLTAALAAQ